MQTLTLIGTISQRISQVISNDVGKAPLVRVVIVDITELSAKMFAKAYIPISESTNRQ